MEAAFLTELAKQGTGYILAALFLYMWMKSQDRNEKLRDAMETTQREHHATTMALQEKGFERSLKAEGALQDSTQALTANNATMQALTVVLARKGIAE